MKNEQESVQSQTWAREVAGMELVETWKCLGAVKLGKVRWPDWGTVKQVLVD